MTPAELTALLATLLADSASWERPLDGFQVGQLKSASSIGRHLAAELRGAPAAGAAFAHDLARVLDEEDAGLPAAAALRRALESPGGGAGGTPAPAELGAALADLLAAARAAGAAHLVARIRALLRDLADTEIEILSGPPKERHDRAIR